MTDIKIPTDDSALVPIAPEKLKELQVFLKSPTTIGFLEFVTGAAAIGVENPANLIRSGGRLLQALASGTFKKQLFDEVQEARKSGKIADENLDSPYGRSVFVELLRAIDEENLDRIKFEALKSIFFKTILRGTDEYKQMLAYQYFQVCKKLTSLDVLVLKTAFEIYGESDSNQRIPGIQEWEVQIAQKIGIPRDLVTQSRLKNSGAGQNYETLIFEGDMGPNRHGLTELGIALGEYIKEAEIKAE